VLCSTLIVNVLSLATAGAHFPPVPGLSGYSPSKTAAASLIGYLQVENPELHITNFHPGILETPVRAAQHILSSP
jgi:NAD(P)-dependent dehydrogenase (short-subunit alcohol dehydrogenase family)